MPTLEVQHTVEPTLRLFLSMPKITTREINETWGSKSSIKEVFVIAKLFGSYVMFCSSLYNFQVSL